MTQRPRTVGSQRAYTRPEPWVPSAYGTVDGPRFAGFGSAKEGRRLTWPLPMKKTFASLMLLALVASACTAEAAAPATEAPTTTSTTTTTTTTPTTTTELDGPRSILNGVMVTDPALTERRVIAVKIDNHWNARPQSGIDIAEAVIELRVEGGLTRFMALFQTTDTEYLGPVRSGRPADAKVIRSLDAPLFISGAQPWVRDGIKAVGVTAFIDVRPGMFRIGSRSAPHNLYADTFALRTFADDHNVPDEAPENPLWKFGSLLPQAKPAQELKIRFSPDFTATWKWDGTIWARYINDDKVSETIDVAGVRTQITADTLVVIVGDFYISSPPAGQSGSPVPSTETVGTGRAVILADGKAIEAVWSRSSPTEQFTLETPTGDQVLVPPGRAWISVVPDEGSAEWR